MQHLLSRCRSRIQSCCARARPRVSRFHDTLSPFHHQRCSRLQCHEQEETKNHEKSQYLDELKGSREIEIQRLEVVP